jgi:prepilin-type N-terminal cleavage/methylation domain-containing protein
MTERGLLRRLRVRLRGGERGFTMVEVAIALVIFGTLILAIATSQSATMNLIRTDRHRSVAANLATEEMETVRATPFTALEPGRLETVRNVDGVPYTVVRDSQWVLEGAESGACDAPPDAEPQYLRVDVFVSWPVMSGVKPVSSHTIVTPPVGSYSAETGHLAVKVLDRGGVGAGGVQVQIAGPASESQFTTADGCAFFAYLEPGAYSANASAAGHVSYQGEPNPTQAGSVAAGGITSLVFAYDRASTLEVSLPGAPDGVPVVVANTYLLPSGLKTFTGTGSPRTLTDLFPFADGYGVWAGTCADANVVDTQVAVDPGASSSVTLALPSVFVTVTQDPDLDGVFEPVEGVAVTAAHAADSGCPAGESYSAGATGSGGELLFALPYGTWQVSVGGTVYAIVLTPEDPGPYALEVVLP